MKYVLAVILISLAPCLYSETLSQPSFQIEVDDGWVYSIGRESQSRDGPENLISIRNPKRTGVLRIQSLRVPDAVNHEMLRELTNVDFSVQLDWERWGDYSGYRYSYFEGGTYFRQWWLSHERTIVFFVFSSTVEPEQAEKDKIDRIVRSITAN